MFTTLQKMNYFIGTSFDVLSTSYTSDNVPFQGLGQDNRAALPLLTWFNQSATVQHFFLLSSCSIISFVYYAFVGNIDLVHVRPGDDHSGSDLIPQMQEALNHWEGGLRTSGGALLPSKSH